MRHLKIMFLFLCMYPLSAQATTQFQRRFGPDSALYNSPLYFAQTRKSIKKRPVKKGSYREQIREKLRHNNRRKSSPQKTPADK